MDASLMTIAGPSTRLWLSDTKLKPEVSCIVGRTVKLRTGARIEHAKQIL